MKLSAHISSATALSGLILSIGVLAAPAATPQDVATNSYERRSLSLFTPELASLTSTLATRALFGGWEVISTGSGKYVKVSKLGEPGEPFELKKDLWRQKRLDEWHLETLQDFLIDLNAKTGLKFPEMQAAFENRVQDDHNTLLDQVIYHWDQLLKQKVKVRESEFNLFKIKWKPYFTTMIKSVERLKSDPELLSMFGLQQDLPLRNEIVGLTCADDIKTYWGCKLVKEERDNALESFDRFFNEYLKSLKLPRHMRPDRDLSAVWIDLLDYFDNLTDPTKLDKIRGLRRHWRLAAVGTKSNTIRYIGSLDPADQRIPEDSEILAD